MTLGIDTILTSGQRSSAWEGALPSGGTRGEIPGNGSRSWRARGITPKIIDKLADCTGVRSFHMSGKKVTDSRMEFRKEGVPMGIPGFSEFEIWQTDRELVRTGPPE